MLSFLSPKRPTAFFIPIATECKVDFTVQNTPECIAKAALLSNSPHSNAIALYGTIGSGKSSLARSLGRDSQIAARFRDAIWHLTVAHYDAPNAILEQLDPFVHSFLPNWHEAYAQLVRGASPRTDVIRQFLHRISGRKVLLVLDKVNDLHGGDIFDLVNILLRAAVDSHQSTLKILSTTRQVRLAGRPYHDVAIEIRPPHAVTFDVQKKILSIYSGVDLPVIAGLPPKYQRDLKGISELAGALPVALSLAGTGVQMLMGHSSHAAPHRCWRVFHESLRKNPHQLNGNPCMGHVGMTEELENTLERLGKKFDGGVINIGYMVRAFGIFPKDGCMPLHVLESLWGVGEIVVKQVADILVGHSLAWRVVRGGSLVGLTIHRVMHESCTYLCERMEGLPFWHLKMIDVYRDVERDDEGNVVWWNVARNETIPYIGANIVRHLIGANRARDALRLLTDYRWVQYTNGTDNPPFKSIQSDLKLLSEHFETLPVYVRRPLLKDLRILQDTLILCTTPYTNHNRSEATFQLQARLASLSEPPSTALRLHRTLLRYADTPWVRAPPGALSSVDGDRKRILRTGFSAAFMCVLNGEVILAGRTGQVRSICAVEGDERFAIGREVELADMEVDSSLEEAYSVAVDGTVFVTDRGSLLRKFAMPIGDDSVSCAQIVPGKSWLVLGTTGGAVKILDAETGRVEKSLQGHSDCIAALSRTSDGEWIVSASWDGMVLVWDSSQRIAHRISGPENPECVAISSHKRLVASGGEEVFLWDIEQGRRIHTPDLERNERATCVQFSSNDFVLYVGTRNKVYVWDLRFSRQTCLARHEWRDERLGTVRGIHIANEEVFVLGSAVFVFRELIIKKSERYDGVVEPSKLERLFEGETLLGVSRDGRRVVTSDGERVSLRDAGHVKEGREESQKIVVRHEGYSVRDMTISSDGCLAYTAGSNNCVVYVTDGDGRQTHRLFELEECAMDIADRCGLDGRFVSDLSFSEDGKYLTARCIVGSREEFGKWKGVYRKWDLEEKDSNVEGGFVSADDVVQGGKEGDGKYLFCRRGMGGFSHSVWMGGDGELRRVGTMEVMPSRAVFAPVGERGGELWLSGRGLFALEIAETELDVAVPDVPPLS